MLFFEDKLKDDEEERAEEERQALAAANDAAAPHVNHSLPLSYFEARIRRYVAECEKRDIWIPTLHSMKPFEKDRI